MGFPPGSTEQYSNATELDYYNTKQEALLAIIKHALQPDELVRWWCSPSLKNIQISWLVEIRKALISTVTLTTLLGILMYAINNRLLNIFVSRIFSSLPFVCIAFVSIFLWANDRYWRSRWWAFRTEVPSCLVRSHLIPNYLCNKLLRHQMIWESDEWLKSVSYIKCVASRLQ